MITLCCMSLTLSARMIATLGLSVSILVINIVISEYFGRPHDEFFFVIEPWSFLGLNWTRFLYVYNVPKRNLVIFSCYIGYLLVYLSSCSLLAIGTVVRRPKYSILWLYLHIFSIADQLITLISYPTISTESQNSNNSIWYLPFCGLYLLCTVYFWMVVLAAYELWLRNPDRSEREFDMFNSITYDDHGEIIAETRTEKSPSFLAQNYLLSEATVLPLSSQTIPDKYDIV